ncbi:MAG: hypothetical protein Q7T12_06210 [Flavobacterium sp.]|nr:hypothetical protein [Flavobacterium sp.]
MEILQSITIADWINIFIAGITLLTAIIALLTINEMRKQRVHSYFPDINMADFTFYVYKGDFDEHIKSIYLYSYKQKREENSKIDGFNELKIGINNIGFGVAKNVRWQWNFEIEKAQKILTKNKTIIWGTNEEFITVDSKPLNIEWGFDIIEENIGGNFNFILPFGNENRETEIIIPEYFINLYWLYMVTQLSNKEIPKSIEDDFPQLELNVKYTDIHSNELEKTFYLELKFDMISQPQKSTNQLAILRFEIIEKK